MAVGVHGSFVVKARSKGERRTRCPSSGSPLGWGYPPRSMRLRAKSRLSPCCPWVSLIYTVLLAVLLVGGARWVTSRFTHRD